MNLTQQDSIKLVRWGLYQGRITGGRVDMDRTVYTSPIVALDGNVGITKSGTRYLLMPEDAHEALVEYSQQLNLSIRECIQQTITENSK